MIKEIYNKHYIRLDDNNHIIKGFSDAFENPLDSDVCINNEGGRHFELLGAINPQIINSMGTYLYKYIDNKIVLKTNSEIENEESNLVTTTEISLEDKVILMQKVLDELLMGGE